MNKPDEVFQEGILETSLKAAGVHTNALKNSIDQYKDGKKSLVDLGKDINTNAVKPASKTLGKIDDVLLHPHKVGGASIIARAKKSILQFPVYISKSGVPVEAAHIVAKIFEKVYATLVQTVLSNSPNIDEEDVNDLVFLKQFHTNLKEAADSLVNIFYEPIDEFDAMLQESIFHQIQLNDDLIVEFRVIPAMDENLIMESSRLSNEPLTGLRYIREADEDDEKQKRGIEQVRSTSETRTPEVVTKVLDDSELENYRKAINNGIKDPSKKKLNNLDDLKSLLLKSNKGIPLGNDENPEFLTYRKGPKGENEFVRETHRDKVSTTTSSQDKRDPVPTAKMLLKDTEVKKINSMTPYVIEATFRIKNSGRDVKYLIGIKTILHIIDVKDIRSDLKELITGDVKSLQKVRYTTGEIGFKDYWFNIKGIKADAAKHVNYNKRWLNTLKRLGEYDKMYGTLLKKGIKAITGGDVPIPNGTMILSGEDVNWLKSETGIDLSNAGTVRKLAKSIFLIAFGIIDRSDGTLKVLFPDDNSDWDIQSIDNLESEISRTDDSKLRRALSTVVR